MTHATQHDEIRRILIDRRRNLLSEIHNGLRDARADASAQRHYRIESGETTEVHPEDDLAFALIDIKAQLLNRINDAMKRLDDGSYGSCDDCANPIAASRLRALPFAVRCMDCEEMRELSEPRGHLHPRYDWQRC
jgi:DnaK suppressor protein